MIKKKIKRKTFLIAEIGPNHNGSFKRAVKMVRKLASIGVDSVKFQIAEPNLVYSDDSFKADYQKKNDRKKTIFEMSKNLQLSREEHIRLSKICKKLGVIYACTAFDLKSLIFLDKIIKVPFFKIASGEISSLDMIDYIAKRKKPILLSTGTSTFDEIGRTFKRLKSKGNKKITILHCVSAYPAKDDLLNLNVIDELKKKYKTKIGFSDHSLGNDACLAAIAKGACIIEKHVTESTALQGPDHKASSTIKEFKELVNKIKKFETMLGSNRKVFSSEEINVKKVSRKSIVTKRDITKGSKLKRNDIVFKRPGIGISPFDLKKYIGKKFLVNKKKNKVVFSKDLN